MKLKLWPIIALFVVCGIMIIAGCEDNRDYQYPYEESSFSLTSSIPLNMTSAFPRSGKVILHFNREIDQGSIEGAVTFKKIEDDGTETDVLNFVGAVGANLFITPRSLLAPSSDYKVMVTDSVRSIDGEVPAVPEQLGTITFSTGSIRAQAFERPWLLSVNPDPETGFISDSVTFHVQFSEPLDEARITYPGNIKITKNSNEVVPANIFVCDDMIVIDPLADLDSQSDYSLEISGVTDRNGETLNESFSKEFTVVSTLPKSELPVIICPTLGDHSTDECPASSDPANLPPSSFTGDLLNTMTIESTLLGRGAIYVSGKLVTEIGNPAINENFVPITIRKGQKLYGKGIDVLLGGRIETGYNSGDIVLTLISDANGILAGSQFIYGVEGAKVALTLTMDVVVNTSSDDPATNAMLTQPVLGVNLSGAAWAKDGKLTMEVAGFTEMKVQGEQVPTTMAMIMVSMDKSDPTMEEDVSGPRLRSTTPEINQSRVRLTERIVANFDEPLDSESVKDNFSIQTINGAIIAGEIETLGAKVIFTPDNYLAPSTEYLIVIGEGIADLNENTIGAARTIKFRTGTDEASELEDNPPLVTTVHPGIYDAVDVPAQFPVIICFNQVMDRTSIRLGDTFSVVDKSAGNENIRGAIYFHGSYLVFEPNDLWEKGHTYRVTISDRITNFYGLALDLDGDRIPGGGEGFSQVFFEFRAGAENGYVLLALKLDPLVDTDGSGYVDGNETGTETNSIKMNVPVLDLFKEPSYVGGHMITWVKGLDYDENSVPFVGVDINDGAYLNGTSINASLFKSKAAPDGLFEPMGLITIDVIQTGSADISKGSGGQAQMNINLKTLFNVENNAYNDMLRNNLELSTKGILTFSKDGKMVADISGATLIKGNFEVPLVGWDIPLLIPTNIKLRAVGSPLPFY